MSAQAAERQVEVPSTVGKVRGIRVLRVGVQAEVCMGFNPVGGTTWLKLEAHSAKVRAALKALEEALVDEADTILRASQKEREARGQRAIG